MGQSSRAKQACILGYGGLRTKTANLDVPQFKNMHKSAYHFEGDLSVFFYPRTEAERKATAAERRDVRGPTCSLQKQKSLT